MRHRNLDDAVDARDHFDVAEEMVRSVVKRTQKGSIVNLKGTAEVAEVTMGGKAHDDVGGQRRQDAKKGVLTFRPIAGNQVKTPVKLSDQQREFFGKQLKVTVHQNHRPSPAHGQCGGNGRLLAVVLEHVHHYSYTGVTCKNGLQLCPSAIVAAVIDENNFKRPA